MRRPICFVVAAALFLGGAYFLYQHMTYGQAIVGRAMLLGIALTGAGGVWLWFDFIGPKLGVKGDA